MSIEKQQRARSIKSILMPFFDDRQNELITRLCMMYYSGEINYDVVVGTIGEIAGMRSIIGKLDRDLKND
jgi:hypothetical protein